jgi:hypothetical protein
MGEIKKRAMRQLSLGSGLFMSLYYNDYRIDGELFYDGINLVQFCFYWHHISEIFLA